MDRERLRQLFEIYGSAPEHWPVAERGQALTLLERLPEMAALQQDAGALDHLLDQSAEEDVNPALAARILEQAAVALEALSSLNDMAAPAVTEPVARGKWRLEKFLSGLDAIDWSLKSLLQPAALLGCVALVGLTTGIFVPEILEQALYGNEIEEGLWQVAFDNTDLGLEGLSSTGDME